MTYSPKMELTKEQSAIMAGRKGEARAYMMESLVRYGDLMGAKRLVPLDYPDIQAAFYPGPDNEKRLLSRRRPPSPRTWLPRVLLCPSTGSIFDPCRCPP